MDTNAHTPAAPRTRPDDTPAAHARAGGASPPAQVRHDGGDRAHERVLLDLRPDPLMIVLRRLGSLSLLCGLGAAAWLVARAAPIGISPAQAAAPFLAAAVLVLLWQSLEWSCRRYTLTDRAVRARHGVLRTVTFDVPLGSIRHAVVLRSLRERVCGLGSVGFATAGMDVPQAWWTMIARPAAALEAVRSRLPGVALPDPSDAPGARQARLPVIGLAGGIGAGKSELARALERLGCVVADSDAAARAALDLPQVRDQLRRWWGDRVIGPDGRVDRGAVSRIVFADPAQRARLEGLVHPIVRAARAELAARARDAGAPALVIDAPLLFEAGLDRECDLIAFVDAPRAVRLERVRVTRGWTEAELDRRESAQLPLEEKRRRSGVVIENSGDQTGLARAAVHLLDEARRIRGV